MRLSIEHLALEDGLYGPIWDMDTDILENWCTPSTWLFHTIAFNQKHNIQLHIKHEMIQPRRTKDKSLMDLAYNYSKISTTLKAINRVRMLHEIIHLNDVTTANGAI